MKRKLLNDYCNEVLGVKQEVLSYEVKGSEVYIVFEYDENYIYQEDVSIHIVDLISFVYSKI